MIFKVFLAGAFATIPAFYFQVFSKEAINIFGFEDYGFVFLVVSAAIEEILKFLAAYLIVKKSRFFDEPIDAMIYMVVSALGFAMVENIASVFGANDLSDAIGITILRFVGATLLHALSSGLLGYYWAKSKIFRGIIYSTVLHGIFNYLIITFEEKLIYPAVFLVLMGFFIFADFERIKDED